VFSPRPVTNPSLVGMSAGDDPAGDDQEVIKPPPWERKKDRAEPSGRAQRFPLGRDEPDYATPPLRRVWRDFIHRRKK
jgi:hypothetical protein